MHPIFLRIFTASLLLVYSLAATAIQEAEEAFESAWNHPSYTQFKLDDIDINETLENFYTTATPVHFTRKMLWDMETKKAWAPGNYIPYVVSEGRSWGRICLENGDEHFVRSSRQKQWLNSEVYGEVFEKVYLNHKDQKATFLGTDHLSDSSGNEFLLDTNHQPLFHVQHSVAGTEDQPINVWRIVHLTEEKDQQLLELFKRRNNSSLLPGFVELYITNDLQTPIKHK